MSKLVTLDELRAHNKKDDLYILIHGKGLLVRSTLPLPPFTSSFNSVQCNKFCRRSMPPITFAFSFLISRSTQEVTKSSWPKPVRPFLPLCVPELTFGLGQDATEAFEDVGHSDEARELLPAMLVGDFDSGSVCIAPTHP